MPGTVKCPRPALADRGRHDLARTGKIRHWWRATHVAEAHLEVVFHAHLVGEHRTARACNHRPQHHIILLKTSGRTEAAHADPVCTALVTIGRLLGREYPAPYFHFSGAPWLPDANRQKTCGCLVLAVGKTDVDEREIRKHRAVMNEAARGKVNLVLTQALRPEMPGDLLGVVPERDLARLELADTDGVSIAIVHMQAVLLVRRIRHRRINDLEAQDGAVRHRRVRTVAGEIFRAGFPVRVHHPAVRLAQDLHAALGQQQLDVEVPAKLAQTIW